MRPFVTYALICSLLAVLSACFEATAEPISPVTNATAAVTPIPAVGTNLVLQSPFVPSALLDPMIDAASERPETPLWNLHRDAMDALKAGDTNRFQRLTALYWRGVELSKNRTNKTERTP